MAEDGEISESPPKKSQTKPLSMIVPSISSINSSNQTVSNLSNVNLSTDNDRRYSNRNLTEADQFINRQPVDKQMSREEYDSYYYGNSLVREYSSPRDTRLYNQSRAAYDAPQGIVRSTSRDPYDYEVDREDWNRDRNWEMYRTIDPTYSRVPSFAINRSYSSSADHSSAVPKFRNYGDYNTKNIYGPTAESSYPNHYSNFEDRVYDERTYDERFMRPPKRPENRLPNQSPRARIFPENSKPFYRSQSDNSVLRKQEFSSNANYQYNLFSTEEKQTPDTAVPPIQVPNVDKLIASNAIVPPKMSVPRPSNPQGKNPVQFVKPDQPMVVVIPPKVASNDRPPPTTSGLINSNGSSQVNSLLSVNNTSKSKNENPSDSVTVTNNNPPSTISSTNSVSSANQSSTKLNKPILPKDPIKTTASKNSSPFPTAPVVSRSVDDILGLKKSSNPIIPVKNLVKNYDDDEDISNSSANTPRFSVGSGSRTRVAWGQGIIRKASSDNSMSSNIENINQIATLTSYESNLTFSSSSSEGNLMNKSKDKNVEESADPDGLDILNKTHHNKSNLSLTMPESNGSYSEGVSPVLSPYRKRGRKPGSKVVRGHVVSAEELATMTSFDDERDDEVMDEEQDKDVVVDMDEDEEKIGIDETNEIEEKSKDLDLSDSDDEPNGKKIKVDQESQSKQDDEIIEGDATIKRRRGRKPNSTLKKVADNADSVLSDETTIQITSNIQAILAKDSVDDGEDDNENAPKKLGRPFGKGLSRGRGRGSGGGRGNFRKSIMDNQVIDSNNNSGSVANVIQPLAKKPKSSHYHSAASSLAFYSNKSRSLLGTMVSTPEDVYRTFHAIRYMVELQQYASSDKSDYVKLLTSNVSIPATVAKIPLPTNHEICYCLELLESASDNLYEHLIDIRRKQYLLEGIWTTNYKDRNISKVTLPSPVVVINQQTLQSNPIVKADKEFILNESKDKSSNLRDKFSNDSKFPLRKRFSDYSSSLKNTISTIYEHNKLRIAEAHLYATVLPQPIVKPVVTTNTPPIVPTYANMNTFSKNRQFKAPITPITDIISTASKGLTPTNSSSSIAPTSSPKTIAKSLSKIPLITTSSVPIIKPPTETKQFKATAQRIIQIRPHIINEIRRRKMTVRKTWEELGDKYLEAYAKWDYEVNSDSVLNDNIQETTTTSTSNNNSGYLNSGQRSSNRFLGVTQPLEFDANGFQVLPQHVAELRYINGAAEIPPLVSPWLVSDPINNYPAPPSWPLPTTSCRSIYNPPIQSHTNVNTNGTGTSLKKIKSKLPPSFHDNDVKINAVNGSTISTYKLPCPPIVEVSEPIDFSSNRYTIDGKRQHCIGLDLNEKCQKYCNCMRQVDKKLERNCKLWTDMEKSIFLDKFLQFPKNFKKISKFLINRTIKEVIKFYYDSKATIPYKALLKEIDNKRKNSKNLNINSVYSAKSVGCGYFSTIHTSSNINLNNVTVGTYNSANALSSMSNSISGNCNELIIQLPVDDMTYNTYLYHPPYMADSFGLPRPISYSHGQMPVLPTIIPRPNTILQANKRFINNINEIKLKCQYDDIDELPDDYENILKLSEDSNSYYNLNILPNKLSNKSKHNEINQRTIEHRNANESGASSGRGRGIKVGGRRGGRGRGSSGIDRSHSSSSIDVNNMNYNSTITAINNTSTNNINSNYTNVNTKNTNSNNICTSNTSSNNIIHTNSTASFDEESKVDNSNGDLIPLPPLARRKHSKDYGKIPSVTTTNENNSTNSTVPPENITIQTNKNSENLTSNSTTTAIAASTNNKNVITNTPITSKQNLGNLALNNLKLESYSNSMIIPTPTVTERNVSFSSVGSAYVPADVTLFSSSITKIPKQRKPKVVNTATNIIKPPSVKPLKTSANPIKPSSTNITKPGIINSKLTNIVKLPSLSTSTSNLPVSLNFIKSGINQNTKTVGLYSTSALKKPKLITTITSKSNVSTNPITKDMSSLELLSQTVSKIPSLSNNSSVSVTIGTKRDYSSLSSNIPITPSNPVILTSENVQASSSSTSNDNILTITKPVGQEPPTDYIRPYSAESSNSSSDGNYEFNRSNLSFTSKQSSKDIPTSSFVSSSSHNISIDTNNQSQSNSSNSSSNENGEVTISVVQIGQV